ncbi:MAG TPA: STAS domain-containing protein [Pseudonocardiaceae bacterium]
MPSSRRPDEPPAGRPPAGEPENSLPRGLLDAVVEYDDRHHAVVIRLSGEIDHYTAPILGTTVDEALSGRSGRRLLVIDLERVEFIGSPGLAELIIAAERAQEAGMAMRLAAANATVRMLVAVTGTGALLTLSPTVADALTGG